MLNFSSLFSVIKAKILLLKSLVLAFVAPYVGVSLAATLFYILSAVVSLFLVYMAVMAVIKIGGMFVVKKAIPVDERKLNEPDTDELLGKKDPAETNTVRVNKDNTSELPGKKILPGKDDTGIPVVEENVSELSSENVLPGNSGGTEVNKFNTAAQQDSRDDSDDKEPLAWLKGNIVSCKSGVLNLKLPNGSDEKLVSIRFTDSSGEKDSAKAELRKILGDESSISGVNIMLIGTSSTRYNIYGYAQNIELTPKVIEDLVQEIEDLKKKTSPPLNSENNVEESDDSSDSALVNSNDDITDNNENGIAVEGGSTTPPNPEQLGFIVSGGGDRSEEHSTSSTPVMSAITDKLDQAAILDKPCTSAESEEVQERIDSKAWDEIIQSFSNSGKDNVIFKVEDEPADQIILHAEAGNIELSGSLLGKVEGITELSKSICLIGEDSLDQEKLERILKNFENKQVTVSSETENSEDGQVVLSAEEGIVELSRSILLTAAGITDLSQAMLTTAEARAAAASLAENLNFDESDPENSSGSSGFHSADGSDASRQSPNSEENSDVESSDDKNQEPVSEEGSVDLVNAPLHSSAIPNGSLVQPVVKQNNDNNGSEEYSLDNHASWAELD